MAAYRHLVFNNFANNQILHHKQGFWHLKSRLMNIIEKYVYHYLIKVSRWSNLLFTKRLETIQITLGLGFHELLHHSSFDY